MCVFNLQLLLLVGLTSVQTQFLKAVSKTSENFSVYELCWKFPIIKKK